MGSVTWLCGLTENGIGRMFRAADAGEGLTDLIGDGARRLAAVRGYVDRSMHGLLNMLNLPSKTDYNRLLAKVEVLQGSLVNLNLKVDRILAAQLASSPRSDDSFGPRGATDPDLRG